MALFEFPYGRPCRTPLSWDRLEDRVLVGPEAILFLLHIIKKDIILACCFVDLAPGHMRKL
jgi:hypothetical protein